MVFVVLTLEKECRPASVVGKLQVLEAVLVVEPNHARALELLQMSGMVLAGKPHCQSAMVEQR